MAAFHICGRTLHSTLQLPVRTSSYKDLQGRSLHQLQLTMKNKFYLIIDEMSMLGQRMMAWVDKRLCQATGQLDIPFGGVSVILFGDFAQLPPVGDRPLYSTASTSSLAVHGHTMYRLFTTVVTLTQALRQAGSDSDTLAFRNLLLRLRDGAVNHDDWRMLLQHTPQTVMTLQMQSDSFMTKQVLLNTTYINCTISKPQWPELMPFIPTLQPLQQTPTMQEAYTRLSFLQHRLV